MDERRRRRLEEIKADQHRIEALKNMLYFTQRDLRDWDNETDSLVKAYQKLAFSKGLDNIHSPLSNIPIDMDKKIPDMMESGPHDPTVKFKNRRKIIDVIDLSDYYKRNGLPAPRHNFGPINVYFFNKPQDILYIIYEKYPNSKYQREIYEITNIADMTEYCQQGDCSIIVEAIYKPTGKIVKQVFNIDMRPDSPIQHEQPEIDDDDDEENRIPNEEKVSITIEFEDDKMIGTVHATDMKAKEERLQTAIRVNSERENIFNRTLDEVDRSLDKEILKEEDYTDLKNNAIKQFKEGEYYDALLKLIKVREMAPIDELTEIQDMIDQLEPILTPVVSTYIGLGGTKKFKKKFKKKSKKKSRRKSKRKSKI